MTYLEDMSHDFSAWVRFFYCILAIFQLKTWFKADLNGLSPCENFFVHLNCHNYVHKVMFSNSKVHDVISYDVIAYDFITENKYGFSGNISFHLTNGLCIKWYVLEVYQRCMKCHPMRKHFTYQSVISFFTSLPVKNFKNPNFEFLSVIYSYLWKYRSRLWFKAWIPGPPVRSWSGTSGPLVQNFGPN